MRSYIILLVCLVLLLLYLIDTFIKYPAQKVNIRRFRFVLLVLIVLFIVGLILWVIIPNGTDSNRDGRGQSKGKDTKQTYLDNHKIIIEVNDRTIIVDSKDYVYSSDNKEELNTELTKILVNYDEVWLIDDYGSSAAFHFVEDIVEKLFAEDKISFIENTTK